MKVLTPLPIHLADAHKDLIPHSYVIQVHTQRCACCHTTHTHSVIYAKTHIKARMERGKFITNLRPVSFRNDGNDKLYNLPIEQMFLPEAKIPFCHACAYHASLAHWPNPPEATADQPVLAAFQAATPPKEAPKPPTRARKPTIDDLI